MSDPVAYFCARSPKIHAAEPGSPTSLCGVRGHVHPDPATDITCKMCLATLRRISPPDVSWQQRT